MQLWHKKITWGSLAEMYVYKSVCIQKHMYTMNVERQEF